MIVTYTPAGQDTPQVWRFDPDEVKASKMEMIERRWAGGADPESGPSSYDRWLTAVQNGEVKARHVLLWHLLSLEHHTIRFEDVDFTRRELRVELSKDEYARLIDAVRNGKRPPAQKERIIASLLDDQAQAPDDPDGEGKVTSPSGVAGGGQP